MTGLLHSMRWDDKETDSNSMSVVCEQNVGLVIRSEDIEKWLLLYY
jgi:hypothetical protein